METAPLLQMFTQGTYPGLLSVALSWSPDPDAILQRLADPRHVAMAEDGPDACKERQNLSLDVGLLRREEPGDGLRHGEADRAHACSIRMAARGGRSFLQASGRRSDSQADNVSRCRCRTRPAAMTPIMLARMYGGRPAIAVQVVIFTTVLSVFSLPWIITLGCRWIGLNPQLP